MQLTPYLPSITRNVGLRNVRKHLARGVRQLLTLYLHDNGDQGDAGDQGDGDDSAASDDGDEDGDENIPVAPFIKRSILPLTNCIVAGTRPAFAPREGGAGWQWNLPATQQQGVQPEPRRVTEAQKRCLEETYELLRACLGLHRHERTSLDSTDGGGRTWVERNPRRIFAFYFLLGQVLAPEYNAYLQVCDGTFALPRHMPGAL